MLCPSCKKEIEPGDLLIHWYTPDGEVGFAYDDDLKELRSDLEKGIDLAQSGVEFEHVDTECFYHWHPSEEELKLILEE